MDSEKVLCKVIIRNGNSKTCSVTGEITLNQLESRECEWLVIQNVILKDNKYNCNDMVIYKADIERIIVFKPTKSFAFDKVDFGLYENIQFL